MQIAAEEADAATEKCVLAPLLGTLETAQRLLGTVVAVVDGGGGVVPHSLVLHTAVGHGARAEGEQTVATNTVEIELVLSVGSGEVVVLQIVEKLLQCGGKIGVVGVVVVDLFAHALGIAQHIHQRGDVALTGVDLHCLVALPKSKIAACYVVFHFVAKRALCQQFSLPLP